MKCWSGSGNWFKPNPAAALLSRMIMIPVFPIYMPTKIKLIQAILNIARNAVQAVDGKGNIIFKTRIHRQMTVGRKRYKLAVKCDIIDNGPGIDVNMMSQIFYP